MDDGLQMWIIYDHPADYPDGWVVRRRVVKAGSDVPDKDAQYAPTLEEARKLLPQRLTNIGRQPGDDPVIAEVWI